GLDHAKHAVDGRWSDARSNRRPAGGGVGRGNIGIGTVIDVEQRPLGSLQQNAASVLDGAVQKQPSVRGQRQQSRRQPFQQPDVLIQIGPLGTLHQLQQLVGAMDPVGQKHAGALDPAKIDDPNAASTVLVLIRRADAATGGAELLALFARGVEQLVIRQNQMGAIGDEEPSGGVDTALVQAIELGKQVLRLQDNPVADQAGDARVQDP